jgi:GntR family transcriptional regulator
MLELNRQSNTPIYEQIIKQIERLIIIGNLLPEELIPSVRCVSLELSVNPNTIQKAYNELELKNITYSVPGIGRFVSKNARELITLSYSLKLDGIYSTIYELALAGIPCQTVLELIKSAYGNAEIAKMK